MGFDEKLPGLAEQVLRMLRGEKAFLRSAYARALIKAMFVCAQECPCIFVGRGAHLVLPRDKILAVRIIASMEFRIKRVSGIMKSGYKETERKLMEIDREQKEFFKKLYGKTGSSPYEFDLVINRDFLEDKAIIAYIIMEAYRKKFQKEA
jgi:cytidylate kinase